MHLSRDSPAQHQGQRAFVLLTEPTGSRSNVQIGASQLCVEQVEPNEPETVQFLIMNL